jgi:hypothetical protein
MFSRVATPAPRRRLEIVITAPSAPLPGPLRNKKLMPARVMSAVVRHLDLVSALILIMLATFLGTDLFSAVRFDQEKIEVWAVEGQIQVRGLYHYENRTILPVSFSLGLPFPIDPDHPVPSTFSVTETDATGTWEPVSLRTYHGNYVFRLICWPKQARWIQVDYVQGTRTENGRYILQTTRKWKRALDHGEYILHLGNGLALMSSTYQLNQDSLGNRNTYFFSRVNFYPGEDWGFAWYQTASIITPGSGHR